MRGVLRGQGQEQPAGRSAQVGQVRVERAVGGRAAQEGGEQGGVAACGRVGAGMSVQVALAQRVQRQVVVYGDGGRLPQGCA